jgi:hypothetical protein
MVGAMIVLLLVVIAFVAFRNLTSNDPSSPVRSVAYQQDARFARQAATFHLLAPARLPHGWRATTVRFTPGPNQHWHLGLLTTAGRYVGLEQGNLPVRDMVRTYVDPHPVAGRPVDVAGQAWATYTDSGGDRALVRRVGHTTTLVVGHLLARSILVGFTAGLR